MRQAGGAGLLPRGRASASYVLQVLQGGVVLIGLLYSGRRGFRDYLPLGRRRSDEDRAARQREQRHGTHRHPVVGARTWAVSSKYMTYLLTYLLTCGYVWPNAVATIA